MPKALRRLLHPSDFSAASRGAFAKAVDLARENRAELILLHVRSLVMPIMGDAYMSPQTYEQFERASREAADKQMQRLVADAKKRGVRARGVVAEGVAHEQIVRAARKQKADMIVMGTHGRTGVSKLFLGSVAGRVVSAAPCPVLTVRGK
jgi:nucleotide-binding universal stress UspA family protein